MAQYLPIVAALFGAYVFAIAVYFVFTTLLGRLTPLKMIRSNKLGPAYALLSTFLWIIAASAGALVIVAVSPSNPKIVLSLFVLLLSISIAQSYRQQRPTQTGLLSGFWIITILIVTSAVFLLT